MILDKDDIKSLLPHREPFLFVDSISNINLRQDITGLIKFPEDSYFFKGHFPDRPVVPGVIIIESLAQLGGVLIYKSFEEDLVGKDPALVSVDSAKFKSPTLPNEELTIKATLMKNKLNIFKLNTQAYKNDKLVVEANITATVLS